MSGKRLLFTIHRWLGVFMCLFFAMWFASGVVMMYVEYPELTEQERLANLPALSISDISVPVERILKADRMDGRLASVKLTSIGNRPAYQLRTRDDRLKSVYADTGEIFGGSDEDQAIAAVMSSGFWLPGTALHYEQSLDMDQWTVSSALNRHRPLHKVSLEDERGTVVYVSDHTGQIVRDTNRHERFWNWFGSTLHWIYPYQLRRHADVWADVIIYLSLLGILSVLTGIVIGLMRLRLKKRYKGDNISPYTGAAWWHHLLGLISSIFVTTYIFSGLMSMGPWGIFDARSSFREQVDRYSGTLDLQQYPSLTGQSVPKDIKEIDWVTVGSEGHLVLSRSADDRVATISSEEHAVGLLQQRIDRAIPHLSPENQITSVNMLRDYDSYYYARHNRYRPLPVYRVKFDDLESTWFHIDATTGTVVTRHTDKSRLERWLFNGLHSLDFIFLIERGVLWDIVVIILSTVGFVFSVTSVIVAWRSVTSRSAITKKSLVNNTIRARVD